MEKIKVINDEIQFPEKYQISKTNRKLIVKTPYVTTIIKLLKGDFHEQIQKYFLNKQRKGFEKDDIEINGKMFKVEIVKTTHNKGCRKDLHGN